jgi:dihydrofolate reductase
MRKIILLMHVSLDGFVAGPKGEMDWIQLGDEMWEYVETITAASDTALYGEVTYHMMEDYWPTAAERPGATKHDIEHGRWANAATKIVFSKTLTKTNWEGTRIVRDNIAAEMQKLKAEPGKNLLMLGSPTLAHSFMNLGLFDELRLNINPVVLGEGKPLFKDVKNKINLKLTDEKAFSTGVAALNYQVLK